MITTKTKFGKKQLSNASPKWLVPVVSSLVILIGVAQIAISGDPSLTEAFKLRSGNYLNALIVLISGVAPFFGIEIKSTKKED